MHCHGTRIVKGRDDIYLVSSHELVWRRAAANLDELFDYVMSFAERGVRKPTAHAALLNQDGSLSYRGKTITCTRKKTGLFTAEETFYCEGKQAPGPGATAMMALIDKELDC
jgi:hypothetical protein